MKSKTYTLGAGDLSVVLRDDGGLLLDAVNDAKTGGAFLSESRPLFSLTAERLADDETFTVSSADGWTVNCTETDGSRLFILSGCEKLPGVTQAKLCMLFTSAVPLEVEEIDVCRLAMSLFGGSDRSRLFLNVREKQSLCYYCGSSLQSAVGCMTVDSGVEPDKAEEAQAAILAELDRLCAGPIEEEELEDCRRGLLNGLESLADSLSGLENWYYMEICRGGEVRTPAQSAARLRAVTREQVRALLARFSFSVAYLVTSPEGGADHA